MASSSSAAFRRIGEWHLPNRVIDAAQNHIPLKDFWTYIPIRCHWCKREMPQNKLTINSGLQLQCLSSQGCRPVPHEEPEQTTTAHTPPMTKKVVVRRK